MSGSDEEEFEAFLGSESVGNCGGDSFCENDHGVDSRSAALEDAVAARPTWKIFLVHVITIALSFASLLLVAGGVHEIGRSSKALVRGRHYRSLEQLRLDIAAASIEMMQEDTVEAANRSQMIDIGPFYDLVNDALDTLGVRGVYMELFESNKFVNAIRDAAKNKGLHGFNVSVSFHNKYDKQPYVKYMGIPNDRVYDKNSLGACSGCKWWLNHYVGAITADKLLREGSLLLGGNSNNSESIYGTAAFMRELQRIERLEDSDIMPFHAQHGFIWQYLAAEMPMLDSYPLEVAEAFCGDLLWKDEYIEHVSNDMARECRHGFGHGVYMVLAVRETVGVDAYSVRQQFRPSSGFLLSDESLCEAYKICSGAPNTKSLQECKGAMRHSYKVIGVGKTFADGSSVQDFLADQEKLCKAAQQAAPVAAAIAPTPSYDGQAQIHAVDEKQSVILETTADVALVTPSPLSQAVDPVTFPSPSSQGIDVAWLMSFPNSGTTYTLEATRKASLITYATNYGTGKLLEHETYNALSVHDGRDSGPFMICCKQTSPQLCPFECPTEGFVLTKTHCGGYGIDQSVGISQQLFIQACLKWKYGGGVGQTSPGYYDLAMVKRAVHLIRDPFDNIVSRFHYERKRMPNAEKRQYRRTPSGFRDFCRDKVDTQPWGHTVDPLVLKRLAGVPCHTDFVRYTMWHDHAFTVTQNAVLPTLIVYYESYGKDWNGTIGALLEFLDQPRIKNNPPLPFDDTKTYRQYFQDEEIEALRSALEVFASGETWSNIQHYFDNNATIATPYTAPVLTQKKSNLDKFRDPTALDLDPIVEPGSVRYQPFDVAGYLDYYFADSYEAPRPAVSKLGKIPSERHPKERKDRFPSIDERVRLYMSNWYLPPCHQDSSDHYIFQYPPPSDFNSTVFTVDVEESASIRKFTFAGEPKHIYPFLVDNRVLPNCSQHEDYRLTNCWSYCQDLLNDVEVLYPEGQIAPTTPPVVTGFGDLRPELLSANYSGPMLLKYRGSASRENIMASTTSGDGYCIKSRERLKTTQEYQDRLKELKMRYTTPSPIIWKLNTHRHFGSNLDKARNSVIPWHSKINGTIWRGSLNGQWKGRSSSLDDKCDKTPRCKLVMQNIDSNVIDAGLTLTHAGELDVWAKKNGLTKETLSVEDQLRYKILISLEGNDVSSGLKWMLLSNSVVLMPPPTVTSWAMEELLEPFVHYVPMNHDGSNAEEMVQWIMDNDDKARRIAERATLFMEDMLYHPDAEKDELEIKREIMRRYRAHWMPAKGGPPLESSGSTSGHKSSLDRLRLDIAAVSIEMMQENTVEAASRSQMIDIGPLYDLIDAGLDTFGVRGIYAGLFDVQKFAQAVRIVADAKGLQDFKAAAIVDHTNGQSYIEYKGIPNDRTYYLSHTANVSGGVWWLWHYVGAITADKLLREGSLLLGGNSNNSERIYGTAAFMRELQRIERLEDSDIMPFHAQHGFIWQYLAAEMPMLDSYPLEVAEAFCGDLLWKDEYIEHVNNDMARECRHGFGHGVYMVLAVRETVGVDAYSVRQQFRPSSGFLLSDESLCEAYKICSGAPNTKTLDECKGAMRHSYTFIGVGKTFADGSSVDDFLVNQEDKCIAAQQAAVAPTSLQPHQGSFLGPNEVLYAEHEPSFIFSPNGQFRFGLDSEGDLSLWNKDSKIWSAETRWKGVHTYVTMQQADGNLVVYSHGDAGDGELKVLWSSGVEGHPDAILRIDNDGQVKIFAAEEEQSVLWETTTDVF